jgi:NAD(P)-dependent dehydrogenase (short-subunit alcohol dehydrogenase family)
MSGICEGRVAIVTGAGGGLGRSHALELAKAGAKVVVNDVGVALDGAGGSSGPADDVVAEIRAAGGEAVANTDDVADFDGAKHLVDTAVDTYGQLDVLVNNAGILRDRMLVNMDIDQWDAVIRVHLRGTFSTAHWAGNHWRDRSKAGETVDARLVNTSSAAGLFGNVGQANYSAAKAGIVGLTLVAGAELARYGVTSNALAPGARTRMTQDVYTSMMTTAEPGRFDPMAPEHVSTLVVWLASTDSAGVNGRVFEVYGGRLVIINGYSRGPLEVHDRRVEPDEFGPIVRRLIAEAPEPRPVQGTGAGPP